MFVFSKYTRFAYRSSKWSYVRKQHLLENPFCAACGRSKKLEVHHIEPVHVNQERELDPTNLITLCADPCHLIFGHFMHFHSWNVHVKEDCSVYLQKLKSRPNNK